MSSPEWLGNDGDAVAVAGMRGEGEGGNGSDQERRDVTVEVMHVLSADERGQERRMGAKCRPSAAAGRPCRRLKIAIRARCNDR